MNMSNQAANSIIISVRRIILSIEAINNICGPGRLREPEVEGLAEAFHGVLEHLPVTGSILESIIRRLKRRNASTDTDEEKQSYPPVLELINDCNTKATQMEKIYQAVIPEDTKSREIRYSESTSVDQTVEVLMRDMLVSMLQVAESPLRVINDSEQDYLEKALEAIEKLPASLVDEPKTGNVYTITNSGSGLQPVHAGHGAQHIHGHNMGGNFHGETHIHSGQQSRGK